MYIYPRKNLLFSFFFLLAFFGAYCQMAPASSGTAHLFRLGSQETYQLETTVLLNEIDLKTKSDVGFRISSYVNVATVWQNPHELNDKLIKFEVKSPKLHIRSPKIPSSNGFVEHGSHLDNVKETPFYAHWNTGTIDYLYINSEDDTSLRNIKKGIASIFQFQLLDSEKIEKDSSGKCLTKYSSLDPHTIIKLKSMCTLGKKIPYQIHPEKILSSIVDSSIKSTYTLSKDLSTIVHIKSEETHEMKVAFRHDAGSIVSMNQDLTIIAEKESKINTFSESKLEEVIAQIESSTSTKLIKDILVLNPEKKSCTGECTTFSKMIQNNYKYLKSDYFGTSRSASAFIKLIEIAREAKKDDFLEVLRNSKNEEIIFQLLDLAGAAQTLEAHEAVMKYLSLNSEEDKCERYFWSLSLGSQPKLPVIKNLLKLIDQDLDEKLKETIILTISGMTRKFMLLNGNNTHEIIDYVKTTVVVGLEQCKEDACKLKYIRALKNLKLQSTMPLLLKISEKRPLSVTALKTLQTFPNSFWEPQHLAFLEAIFYQKGLRYDSSARTIALDILLEVSPTRERLSYLVESLQYHDIPYEIKRYLVQRLNQISENSENLKNTILNIIHSNSKINNYHTLGLKGLSTAFSRTIMKNPSGNGSMTTIQEISNGILKRGIVDIVLEKSGESISLFSLGLFTGGLGSFISSNDANDEEEESIDDPANAGMELTALGIQIRPFIFFNSQSELMGHVWSGTGSERTPAFQTIALLQDNKQFIYLQSGIIIELDLVTSISFDLSGQIQLSIWNRNAESLVEKNAGLFLLGSMRIANYYVKSHIEYNIISEVKLNLVSNINFSGNIALCLQLKQPDSFIKHNIFKVERIPGSKHRLRKSKYKSLKIPGYTYALNRKNNEMCNIIFS